MGRRKVTRTEEQPEGIYSSMLSSVRSTVDDPQLVEQRRAQLISAATKQFVRCGYHSTTIRDIAKEAEVSPGLIYQYIKDKHDLLFMTLLHVVEQNRRQIPPAIHGIEDPVLRFAAAFETYCKIIDANRHAVMLTYRETSSLRVEYRQALKQMEIEQNAVFANIVEECIRLGHFRVVNPDIVTYQLVLIAHGWATKYWRFRDLISLKDYIAENLGLILRSVLTDAARKRYGHLLSSAAPGETGKKRATATAARS